MMILGIIIPLLLIQLLLASAAATQKKILEGIPSQVADEFSQLFLDSPPRGVISFSIIFACLGIATVPCLFSESLSHLSALPSIWYSITVALLAIGVSMKTSFLKRCAAEYRKGESK